MYSVERTGDQYLYTKQNGTDDGTSLAPANLKPSSDLLRLQKKKKQAQQPAGSADALIQTRSVLYRRMRMPSLPNGQAEVLRKPDVEGLLGTDLMVLGTNAFPA